MKYILILLLCSCTAPFSQPEEAPVSNNPIVLTPKAILYEVHLDEEFKNAVFKHMIELHERIQYLEQKHEGIEAL